MPRRKITEDELIEDIQQVGESLGRTPKCSEWRDQGDYSLTPMKRVFDTWANALEAAEFDPTDTNKKVSKDEVKTDIQRVASKLGKTPSQEEYREHGTRSVDVAQDRFGTWNSAVKQAGLEPNDPSDQQITNDELITDIQRVVGELGRTPTWGEWIDCGNYSHASLYRRFGSWTDALEAAGFEPAGRSKEVTKSDVKSDIQRVAEDIGRTPKQREYRIDGNHALSTVFRRYENFSDAVKQAGLEPNGGVQYTEDELIADIKQVASKLGRTPTIADYNTHGECGNSTIGYRFRSWGDALKAAGFDPADSRQIPDDKLLEDIAQVASKLDKTPTRVEYIDYGEHWPETVESRFGSWNDAIEKVGLEPNEQLYSRDYTDDELLADLRRVAAELEATPTAVEYGEYGTISIGPLKDRFGSWNDALEAAGLELNQRIPTKQELLDDLDRVVSKLDKTPTQKEYDKHGNWTHEALHNRFGRYNAALREIGHNPNPTSPPSGVSPPPKKQLTSEELLLELRDKAEGSRITSVIFGNKVDNSESTYLRRFGGLWEAIVRAGLQPASGVPLSASEYYSLIQEAINISHPTTSLLARLKTFTGLPDRKTIPLNQDWITRLESDYQDTLVSIPSEQLSDHYTRDRDWVVKVPTHYTTPGGDKMRTGIEPLLRWHRDTEGVSIGETNRYDATKAWHIAAEKAGVSIERHDLRASVVAHLARRGIEGWQIGMQVGSASWKRSVEDYLLWLWQFEGYTHPDYELTGVFLDPDSGEPERIESDGD